MARNWTGPGERREVVQIAALMIESGRETGRFVRYVKPVFNPILSEYFIELTGITQRTIDDEGVPFLQALAAYKAFASNLPSICYSRDDLILEENCGWFEKSLDMPPFLDARDIVAAAGHDPKQWTSGTVYRLADIERPGSREQVALDDCLSLSGFI